MITPPNLPTQAALIDPRTGRASMLFTRLWDALANAIGGNLPIQVYSVGVASLPDPSPGLVAYASDGRKHGEGAGAGTGVLVFSDATNWCACDTGLPVAA